MADVSSDRSRLGDVALGIAAAAVVALASLSLRTPDAPAQTLPPSSTPAADALPSSPAAAAPADAPTAVLVMGDSSSRDAKDGSPSWAALLATQEGWDLSTDVAAKAAYDAGPGPTLAARLGLPTSLDTFDLDLVLVALGADDAATARAAARSALDALDRSYPGAQVVVVSPPGRGTAATRDAVAAAAGAAGVPHVDATSALRGSPGLVSGKGRRPTAAGASAIATIVAAALQEQGLPAPA